MPRPRRRRFPLLLGVALVAAAGAAPAAEAAEVAATAGEPHAAADGASVVELTSEDFDRTVGDGDDVPWFIKFYAPWCGHCQKLAEPWRELAARVAGKVRVAKVDATVERGLAERFGVRAYPSLKLVAKRRNYTYDGDRTVDALAEYALGGFALASEVAELEDDTFDAVVRHGRSETPWFVLFYAPWCGHCKRLQPVWEQLARRLRGKVSLARVDATAQPRLAAEFGVESYPQLRFFVEDEVIPYRGEGRNVDALEYFALGGFNKTSEVVALTGKSFDTLVRQSRTPWFVKFYVPWCKHCQELGPTWERLADELKGSVGVGKVDATREPELAEEWGVSSFPELKLIVDGNVYDYTLQRSLEALASFARGKYREFNATALPERAASRVIRLGKEDFFRHIGDGRTRGAWFVNFYLPSCGHCKALAPSWAQLAIELEGRVNVASVDVQSERELAEAWRLERFPTLKLIVDGGVYEYVGERTVEALRLFAEAGYKSATAELVLSEDLPLWRRLDLSHAGAFAGGIAAAAAAFAIVSRICAAPGVKGTKAA